MINYSIPTKQKFKRKELIKNSNRGMDLEQLINKSNSFYNENNIAMVFKRPTPIRVVKYDKKTNTSIVEVTIHEGRNHQVKNIFSAIGHDT